MMLSSILFLVAAALLPPLVLTNEDIEKALNILNEVLSAL